MALYTLGQRDRVKLISSEVKIDICFQLRGMLQGPLLCPIILPLIQLALIRHLQHK